MLASFDRVVASGAPELVLVSGYSGIGKSSVVSELHKVLVLPCGLFASGKFDQYKRDIPYSTLAQAFQGLIRPLLGKSDADLSHWRDALQEALGPNGRLIIDLIPNWRSSSASSRRSQNFRHRMRNAASSWYSGASSAYSHGPSIRWRCSSTTCSGSTRSPWIYSRIC